MTSPTQEDSETWELYGPKVFHLDMTGPELVMHIRLAVKAQARAEGYAQGQRDMREAAAKVADEFPAYTEDRTTTPKRTFDDGDWCPERTTITRTFTDPKAIATAIRQIDPAALGAE